MNRYSSFLLIKILNIKVVKDFITNTKHIKVFNSIQKIFNNMSKTEIDEYNLMIIYRTTYKHNYISFSLSFLTDSTRDEMVIFFDKANKILKFKALLEN